MSEDTRSMHQPALDGLAVRKRVSKSAQKAREKAEADNKPAAHQPIARVVLDIQTPHLGKLFDYVIPEKFSETAVPGALIRARFGYQHCTGVVWERADSSDAPRSALKTIERVLGGGVHVGAAMRADIDGIAEYFGGSRANIVRLAVPPRVAKVEKELAPSLRARSHDSEQPVSDRVQDFAAQAASQLAGLYSGINDVTHALSMHTTSSHVIWDVIAGVGQWTYDLAWITSAARLQGRTVVMVLPDMRHVQHMVQRLRSVGFKQFSRDNALGQWIGDFAILNASLSAAERYRAYRAVADGLVNIIVGTRAAMYAPAGHNAVYISFHDQVYQNWDGFTPYPNVADVLRIRAQRNKGIVISVGYVRSRENQWQASHHERSVIEVHGLPAVIKNRSAWVRHLNRAELERLADPAVGARVPSVAVRALRDAASKGPVLFSLPARSRASVVCCAQCRKGAQCRRCMGPLVPSQSASSQQIPSQPVPSQGTPSQNLRPQNKLPQNLPPQNVSHTPPHCGWCNHVAESWSCRHCGSSRMRILNVGTEGTAMELSTLIPGVPVIMSSPHLARGVVEEISNKPSLVIATAGAEPIVRAQENGQASAKDKQNAQDSDRSSVKQDSTKNGDYDIKQAPEYQANAQDSDRNSAQSTPQPTPQAHHTSNQQAGYQCVALVDAWTSLYGTSLDQRIDTLTVWSEIAAMSVPHAQGGQVLILGEAEPVIAQSLMTGDYRVLLQRELADAEQTALPPSVAAVVVWGEKHSVTTLVETVLAEHPEFATISTPEGELPAILGPVSKPAPAHLKQQYMDETYERVQCVIRVKRDTLSTLVRSVHRAQAQHSATRYAAELHVHVNPKSLL